MKKIILLISAVFGTWVAANADDYRSVYSCELKKEKTMDDVRLHNSKWVTFVNNNVEGSGITSHIITGIMGDVTPGKFGFVDSYPSLQSCAAQQAVIESTDEGKALGKEMREILECTEARLYKAEKS